MVVSYTKWRKEKMYQIGELVQYGTSGVCKVEEIVQGIPGLGQNVPCYLLIPVSKKDGILTKFNRYREKKVIKKLRSKELFAKGKYYDE